MFFVRCKIFFYIFAIFTPNTTYLSENDLGFVFQRDKFKKKKIVEISLAVNIIDDTKCVKIGDVKMLFY